MVTGWHFFSDYWFYFKDSGAMQTGWFWDKASNAWYYLDPQYGYMYSDGVRYINGTRYAFTPSGQMVTGWYYETWYSESAQATVGDWCFFNADGTAYNGWLWDDASNAWYYLSHNKMLRGLYEIDGYIFYFDGSGRMATGWTYTDTGFWYHFTGTGAADLGSSGMKLSIPGITWIRPTLTCIQTELTISMAHSIHLTIPAHGSSKDPDKRNGKSRFQVISRFSHSAFFIL